MRFFYFSYCLALAVLFIEIDVKAQTHGDHTPIKATFYYNAAWELTTAENSVYRREAYVDLTDMVFDGVYTDYNRNNQLVADGIYNRGAKTGLHSEYSDHTVKSKIEYNGNDFTIWEWNDGKTDRVKNGSGKFSSVYFYFISVDGKITPKEGIVNGEFRNGRRIGLWTYHDLNKVKTDLEVYVNGKFVRRVNYAKRDSVITQERKSVYLSLSFLNTEALMFDASTFEYLNQYFEKYITYPASFSRNVTYPLGIKNLIRLFSQTMMVPEEMMEIIRLKIDLNGKIEKAMLVRSISPTFDNLTDEILEIHKHRFFPALKNGKPVSAVIYLPVASGERWTQTLDEMPTEWFLDSSNFLD